MGILLGKSNYDPLFSYNVTGNDVKPSNFRNNTRSINKSIQTYVFPEKMSFNYAMSYMQESDYQTLLTMATDRNSLREGLLCVPIPFADNASACILKTRQTAYDQAYKILAVPMGYTAPWLQSWSDLLYSYLMEFTGTEYTHIEAYNTDVVTESSAAFYNGFVFQFDLQPFISAFGSAYIRRLTMPFIGMNSSPYRFYIWSPTNSSWFWINDKFCYDQTLCGSNDGTTIPGNSTYQKNKQNCVSFSAPYGTTSIYADFCDTSVGGTAIVRIMVSSLSGYQQMLVQFNRLLVNGYLATLTDPIDLENYSTTFTGSGRQATLKLEEV